MSSFSGTFTRNATMLKEAVRVATIAALPTCIYSNGSNGIGATLTATANGNINDTGIDGITNLVLNDRILVKNQTNQKTNGIYTLTQIGSSTATWILTRATDFDVPNKILQGVHVFSSQGTSLSNSEWVLTTSIPVTIDGSSGSDFTFSSIPSKLIENLNVNGKVITTSVTNGNIVLTSNSGAIQVTSAGDTRGLFSIDLQTNRGSSDQVAKGDYSLLSGSGNKIDTSGDNGVVLGGSSNYSDGNKSVILGGENNTVGIYSSSAAILGGTGHTISAASRAVIIGGEANTVTSSTHAAILGGGENSAISANYSVVGGFRCKTTGLGGVSFGICGLASAEGDFTVGKPIEGYDSAANIKHNMFKVDGATSNIILGRNVNQYKFWFASTAVNTTSNTITMSVHGMATNDVVVVSGTSLPEPLSDNVHYYVIYVDENTFKLSLTPSGAEIDITTQGSGNIYLSKLGTSTNYITNTVRFQATKASAQSYYIGLRAPISLAQSTILTLPSNTGNVGQVLKSNGSGVMYWASHALNDAYALGNIITTASATGSVQIAGTESLLVTADSGFIVANSSGGSSLKVQIKPSLTTYNNTLIGNNAGAALTDGDSNIAIGNNALAQCTTGINNIALGENALTNNTADANVALGYYAAGNTNENNNVAIGNSSLFTNTSGTYNTAIGTGADVVAPGLTYATALGANAKVNASYSLVLGGTGATAIKVGIGVTAPAQTLEIKGTTSNPTALRLSGATSGSVEFKVGNTGHTGSYTLPTANGSTNQYLKTDGSGNLSWSDALKNDPIALGGGISKVTLLDAVSTELPPYGSSVVIDGVGVANGDLVLFTNLSTGNKRVYEATCDDFNVVSWTAKNIFDNSPDPTDCDMVVIMKGAIHAGLVLKFFENAWNTFNNPKTVVTILDSLLPQPVCVLPSTVTAAIIEYTLKKSGLTQVGNVLVICNGTSAGAQDTSIKLGDLYTSFDTTVTGGDLFITLACATTGATGTLTYSVRAL